MFKIIKNPTFTTTATILVPTDEGTVSQTLKVRFNLLPDDEGPESEDKGIGFLRAAILRIDDVVDEDDDLIPYSDDLRDRLLGMSFVRFGLMRAYFDAQLGRGAAASGN